jgi:hypothetical protein
MYVGECFVVNCALPKYPAGCLHFVLCHPTPTAGTMEQASTAIQKSLLCIRLISFAETRAYYVNDIHLNLCRFPHSLTPSLFFLSFSASFSRFLSTYLQQNTDTGSVNNTLLTGYTVRFSQQLGFLLRSSGI